MIGMIVAEKNTLNRFTEAFGVGQYFLGKGQRKLAVYQNEAVLCFDDVCRYPRSVFWRDIGMQTGSGCLRHNDFTQSVFCLG